MTDESMQMDPPAGMADDLSSPVSPGAEVRALQTERERATDPASDSGDRLDEAAETVVARSREPAEALTADAAFDKWYVAQSHQLTNESLCRLIWNRGWSAALSQSAPKDAASLAPAPDPCFFPGCDCPADRATNSIRCQYTGTASPAALPVGVEELRKAMQAFAEAHKEYSDGPTRYRWDRLCDAESKLNNAARCAALASQPKGEAA